MSQFKSLCVVLLLAFAGSAFAQESTEMWLDLNKMSATTRAEILQMLEDAKQKGLLPKGELGLAFMPMAGTMERERVKAEAAEAQKLGLLASGETNPKKATPEQEKQIKAAGERAVQGVRTMKVSK